MAGTSTSSIVLIVFIVIVAVLLFAIFVLLFLLMTRRKKRTKSITLDNEFNSNNEQNFQVRSLSLERKKHTLQRTPHAHQRTAHTLQQISHTYQQTPHTLQGNPPPLPMDYHPKRAVYLPTTEGQTQIQTTQAPQRESAQYATISGDYTDAVDESPYTVVNRTYVPTPWTIHRDNVDSMRSSVGVDLGGQYEKAYQIIRL
ncbi:hypothetical protein ACF0H5_011089 [Mactra antiquata]